MGTGNDFRDLSDMSDHAAGGCMARSLIGITGQFEAAHWGDWVREAVLSPLTYTRAVERAGGTPVILPPVPADSVDRLTEGLDGIVFTCGADVNPALYDAVPHEKTDQPDRRRDRFEMSLVRAAIDAQLPFLAICRGMHILNVARGGTLPDAVGHNRHAPDSYKMAPHEVHLDAGSTVGQRLGSQARVPALHHQAVQRIGEGLVTVAWADDQVTEAVELRGHPFGVGVQWHPEEGDDLRLFEALVAAAQAAASARSAARAAEDRTAKQPAARGGRSNRATAKARARILPRRAVTARRSERAGNRPAVTGVPGSCRSSGSSARASPRPTHR
jgi:gamma-glutamyl-gamma-aminobutyrate hydrolase PuuD